MKPTAIARLGRLWWVIGVGLCCVVFFALLASFEVGGTVTMDVSYPRLYHDLGSLKRASDVAVSGTIAGVTAQGVSHQVPYTDFSFTPSKVIHDPHHLTADASITIHQTGGSLNNQVVQIGDDPLFQVGERAILFLHQYSPGHYFVVGGPSGRFVVHDGMVTPINGEGIHFSAPVSEDDFISQVQNA